MKTNLELARKCGAAIVPAAIQVEPGSAVPMVVLFQGDQLDAFAERVRAETAKNFDISIFRNLLNAATRVLSDTEAGHRPPLRDRIEAGRMAGVRITALANLHDAVAAIKPEFGRRHSPEEQARLHSALTEVFGWPKTPIQAQPAGRPESSIHAGLQAIEGDLAAGLGPGNAGSEPARVAPEHQAEINAMTAGAERRQALWAQVQFERQDGRSADEGVVHHIKGGPRLSEDEIAEFVASQPKVCDLVQVGGVEQTLDTQPGEIEKAVPAERERCALVADEDAGACNQNASAHHALNNHEMVRQWDNRADTCRLVAFKIRKGPQ